MLGDRWRLPFILLGLTGVYFVAGRVGLSLAYVNASATAVWPPSGIALGALLLLGLRVWPAIALGAFLVNVTTSGVVWASVAIAAGNTLEAVAGWWLVTRYAGGRAAVEQSGTLLRFALLAAGVATAIAASVGTLTLVAGGLAPAADAGSIWVTWWLGDAVGVLLVAPLLILWSVPTASVWSGWRVLEAAALVAVLAFVSVTVFSGSPAGVRNLPLAYFAVPPLLWAAFRFGARETAAASTVLSVVAIRGTLDGYGPFAMAAPNGALLLVQAFTGTTTVMMLATAAEVAARRRNERQVRQLNDTLERRVAERTEALQRVTERLVEAQGVAHVGSWEWDVATDSLWWSEEMARIYGLGVAVPATYEAFLARVHPEDRAAVERAVQQALTGGQAFTLDHRILRPDGSIRVLHANGRVVTNPEGRIVRMTGTGHDVTERKRAEEERATLLVEQAARRDAEEANRAKDHFVAMLSHELRTPLNAALGWTQMLRECPPGDARARRAVDAVYRNLLLQARLVSDILDISRATRGALRLDRAPADLAEIVAAARDLLQEPAAARHVVLEVDIQAGVQVTGDAKRLQQVMWNLLSNAIKFGREGGRVRIRAANRGDTAEIVVEDDGPGIDPSFLPHVFEAFRQADASLTREYGGLGLGLSIARHIVEAHGGTIAARNVEGGGAAFTIRLPIEAEAATGGP